MFQDKSYGWVEYLTNWSLITVGLLWLLWLWLVNCDQQSPIISCPAEKKATDLLNYKIVCVIWIWGYLYI